MLTSIKKEINYKIINLRQIEGLTKHVDIWELQELITSYYYALSVLEAKAEVDIEKLTAVMKPLEEKFVYFNNFTSKTLS
jgi:hypothetical protein